MKLYESDTIPNILSLVEDLKQNGELEKIATHYGIIRKGTLIQEMTAKELKELCPNFVVADTDNNKKAEYVLSGFYERIETAENGIRIYDAHDTAEISVLLYKNGVRVSRLGTEHIGLEEYYTREKGKKARSWYQLHLQTE